MPTGKDEEVQKIIKEAWTDPINEQKLTSFEAQRHRSNDLLTGANLFPTAFAQNGRVRLGFLDPDTVTSIVTDPDDEEVPLYYVATVRRFPWNFKLDREDVEETLKDGVPKVVYWPHWRNVEEVDRIRKENGQPALPKPPKEKLMNGRVYHARINRIGRTQFGTPPWARSLRFMNAMNVLTESHVSMAQGASSLIAKQVVKGSPEQVTARANAVMAQTGEIAAASFGDIERDIDIGGRGAEPPAAGSWWTENESLRLEAVNLSSGAAQMSQTAQIVRAPIAAASQFGQHYLGDASNANLATATSLELPALMNVQSWQEYLEQMIRWFTDLVIEEAVRAGRLGGEEGDLEREYRRPLNELRITEAADREEAEERTGRDLSYKFSMPYPGRRNLPDVVAAVGTIATTYDPGGNNIPLRRKLLLELATHGFQVEDPQEWVDEVLPEETGDAIAQMAAAGIAAGGGQGDPADPQQSDPAFQAEVNNAALGKVTHGTPGAKTGRTGPADEMAEEIRRLTEGDLSVFDLEFSGVLGNGNSNGS
jgi:hypothetical protein